MFVCIELMTHFLPKIDGEWIIGCKLTPTLHMGIIGCTYFFKYWENLLLNKQYLKNTWPTLYSVHAHLPDLVQMFKSSIKLLTRLFNNSASVSPNKFCWVDSRKIPDNRTLKLFSGSCYLPHPDKEKTGGEDAHFICEDEQAIGVADGVGGWADVGVNAGLYARELMSNSVVAIQNEPKGCIDPARVLDKAHSKTKAKGSSTACIITLTDQV